MTQKQQFTYNKRTMNEQWTSDKRTNNIQRQTNEQQTLTKRGMNDKQIMVKQQLSKFFLSLVISTITNTCPSQKLLWWQNIRTYSRYNAYMEKTKYESALLNLLL